MEHHIQMAVTKHLRLVNKKPGDCYTIHTRDGNWYPLEFETPDDACQYALVNPDIVKVETVDGVALYKVERGSIWPATFIFSLCMIAAFAVIGYTLVHVGIP